jgi:hypothetical protein
MRAHGPLACTPRQYHAAHPDKCFVCRRRFAKGITCTHEETGARACSPLCFKMYDRWWLRTKPHVEPSALATRDTAPPSLTIVQGQSSPDSQ